MMRFEAATKIHAHKRADDFAVLVTVVFATQTQDRVYNAGQKRVKLSHHQIKTTGQCDSPGFYL